MGTKFEIVGTPYNNKKCEESLKEIERLINNIK